MKRLLTANLVLLIGISIFGLMGCEKKDNMSINNKEKIKQIKLPKEKGQMIDIDLYFDSGKKDNAIQIAKEERLIHKEDIIGEVIMQELLKGPSLRSNLKPILPKDTKLLSFSIKDGVAYISLSKEAKTSMKKEEEGACLNSIATSISELPSVKKVQILIENKIEQTLGGNYDISKPFGKDYLNEIKK